MRKICMCRLLLSIFLLSLCAEVLADTNEVSLADYKPYLHGRPWPRWPMIAYVETGSNIWVHPTDPTHFPTLQEICDSDSDFATLILRLPNGTVYKTYDWNSPAFDLADVYSGDLNGDGKPDFVAVRYSGGCGLAADYCTGVFAFSDGDRNGNGYKFTHIRSMDLSATDLLIDPATKQFRLVQTSFRGATSLDGRNHNFWVHRFYMWNGSSFITDSTLSPVWIMYLYRPNHEPTTMLTPELKQKAWDEDPESDNIEW
jgi:hypothetical protein